MIIKKEKKGKVITAVLKKRRLRASISLPSATPEKMIDNFKKTP